MKPTTGAGATAAAEFVDASRTLLAADYLPRLRQIVAPLSEEDIWWRPNDASNSIGNLLLHLTGNIRQWILTGVGGAPSRRNRPAEFAARDSGSKVELMAEVEEAAAAVDRVLADAREQALLERTTIQGFEVSRLHAIYHAIEHFSYHLGQIAYVAKLRHGKDLGIFP